MVKAVKAKAKKVVKSSEVISSSAKISSSTLASADTISDECSPPLKRNGAVKHNPFLLNPDEQAAYRKYISEIKQISALVILKTGLAVQELKIITQKIQENYFLKNVEACYNKLSKDPIIGKRVSAIPFKFLTIGTSRAKEEMTGVKYRKLYSVMKSYINNTLSPLWRK